MSDDESNYPVPGIANLFIEDQSRDRIDHPSNKTGKGTMLAKGWQNNYATFEFLGEKGDLTFTGSGVYVEIRNRRFYISLKDFIMECIETIKEGR
jgi:hypothetical protein